MWKANCTLPAILANRLKILQYAASVCARHYVCCERYCFENIRKILKYQISWKFFHWEPRCSKRTDGKTDMTKQIVAFRNFANAPEHRTSQCTSRNNFILQSSNFSAARALEHVSHFAHLAKLVTPTHLTLCATLCRAFTTSLEASLWC